VERAVHSRVLDLAMPPAGRRQLLKQIFDSTDARVLRRDELLAASVRVLLRARTQVVRDPAVQLPRQLPV